MNETSLIPSDVEESISSPILGQHSKIPIASKTTTKVKTIKKHSKPIRDITKSIPRPQIGNIEWDFNEDGQEQETTKISNDSNMESFTGSVQLEEYEFNISDEQCPPEVNESDSDSEDKQSPQSPPSVSAAKRTLPHKGNGNAGDLSGSASGSGSDIALHEAGAESSDEEPGTKMDVRFILIPRISICCHLRTHINTCK